MHIKTLHLHNFRNYRDLKVSFSSGPNLIMGLNAQGKTNLLEAIYLVSTGRSFRTNTLKDLILHKEKQFSLSAQIEKDGILHDIALSFDGKDKKLIIDATSYTSFNPLLGMFPCVLSLPEDPQDLLGFPILRRRFLNLHLAQKNKEYAFHYMRLVKALKNRNALLKIRSTSTLSAWNKQLSQEGAYIIKAREEMLKKITPSLQLAMQQITECRENVEIIYKPSLESNGSLQQVQDGYLEKLQEMEGKDLECGYTQIGPHRDDILFNINDKDARHFASEGQKKSIFLSLRFAEHKLLQEGFSYKPYILLDDIFCHLDGKRKGMLLRFLKDLKQIFITSPEKIKTEGDSSLHCIEIENGLTK